MSVRDKVKQIIMEQLGVEEEQVEDTASIIDDLGADSLDIVELVMAFEEAFDIEIPDGDAEKITTVKDAIDYVKGSASLRDRFKILVGGGSVTQEWADRAGADGYGDNAIEAVHKAAELIGANA